MEEIRLAKRQLGTTGLFISSLGFGAFKIGRNEGTKYEQPYSIPPVEESSSLIRFAFDLGVNYIDTAPSYGTSENIIGEIMDANQMRPIISTKVGETFQDGVSTYDFSPRGIIESVERSCKRLNTDCLDIVFVHANRSEQKILSDFAVFNTLKSLCQKGKVRHIGYSGLTVEGNKRAIEIGYEVLMVEYNLMYDSHLKVMEEAEKKGVGVIVKKALASGKLSPQIAIPFALSAPAVTSVLIGTVNQSHLAECIHIAKGCDL